ncbi:MAG: SDR family oxidoreductase [Bacteroidetes bacterium]|nr:SDR family oxidoreductase [Bacteroidota bacterium]
MEDEETRKKQVENIPMKRAGEPEEVAHLALFLASEDSNYVNGSTYVIDGALMQNVGQGA